MKCISIALALLISIPVSQNASGQNPESFERITPEQAGYSSEKLDGLRSLLEESGSDSLLLLHDGKVFFEWGNIHKKILVHSIRKALLNSLYGGYEKQGLIDLQKNLAELGIDDTPDPLTAREREATLADVLKSRSGVYHPAAAESEGMIQARPMRGSKTPGEFYYYNNWDFNVAGAVFEMGSGMRIYDAFYEKIAKPIGMADYKNNIIEFTGSPSEIDADADGYYQFEPDRSKYPAYHFRLSANDLALFGQLYLNRGIWNSAEIIPSGWIDRSTQPYSIVNPDYGLAYGMLWNVLVPENPEEVPSFYHTGVGVHMLGVYPKHKLVMVHRVDTERDFDFDDGDLYAIIRMVHGARMKSPAAE